jgi:glycosyltransferase involved in cell wall biosynthesis|tara:strand:+ start:436 stop:1287 length:852 start_codon:yes stop_codon:yes gene_type:complete
MRILFISDFTLEQRGGGAQVSNNILIEKGKELGYEIKEHSHSSSITDFLTSYDLVINSNLEVITKISPEKIPFILKMPNSVRLEHDSCSYLDDDTRLKLFSNAKKNYFLSDFHLRFFNNLYGDYFKNVEIVYDPINTDIFKKAEGLEKFYDVVYCGYLHPLKGLNNLLNFARSNPDRKVDIFGWSDVNTANLFNNIPNINFRGQHNHEKMASIFQRCNAVFHSPVVNEPFCRMVAEALLCGVEEIIGNKSKIGAYLEFEKIGYDKFKDRCESAASKFWETVVK